MYIPRVGEKITVIEHTAFHRKASDWTEYQVTIPKHTTTVIGTSNAYDTENPAVLVFTSSGRVVLNEFCRPIEEDFS
jgi:hypothetical protein